MNEPYHEDEADTECLHAKTEQVRLSTGVHWGKEMCLDCGRFVRWIPAPKSDNLDDYVVPEEVAPVKLTGSEAQVKWATAIRLDLVKSLREASAPEKFIRGMKSIAEASWWIANRGRSFEQIRWPADWLPGASTLRKAPAVPTAPTAPTAIARPGPPQPPAAPRKPVQVAEGRFTAELTQGPDEKGLYHLMVSFDGRSSGTLRLLRAELVQLRATIDQVLEP